MSQKISFVEDNFAQRRASQEGSGVAYDPESLLTGDEIARGLDYGDLRSWPNEETKQLAYTGGIAVDIIPTVAPRRSRTEYWGLAPLEESIAPDFRDFSNWHELAQAELDDAEATLAREPRVR